MHILGIRSQTLSLNSETYLILFSPVIDFNSRGGVLTNLFLW